MSDDDLELTGDERRDRWTAARYVEGDLSASSAAAFLARVREEPALAAELERQRVLSSWVDGWVAASRESAPESSGEAVLRAVRRRARRARVLRRVRFVVAAAAALALVAVPLWVSPSWRPASPDDLHEDSADTALLLENLDVIEAIEAEAGEVSLELVDLLLLEVLDPDDDGGVPLDSGVFDYILEEELASQL